MTNLLKNRTKTYIFSNSKISRSNSKFSDHKIEKNKKIGTDLGWFGGALEMVWEYFRDDFRPTLKIRKFESSELKN